MPPILRSVLASGNQLPKKRYIMSFKSWPTSQNLYLWVQGRAFFIENILYCWSKFGVAMSTSLPLPPSNARPGGLVNLVLQGVQMHYLLLSLVASLPLQQVKVLPAKISYEPIKKSLLYISHSISLIVFHYQMPWKYRIKCLQDFC